MQKNTIYHHIKAQTVLRVCYLNHRCSSTVSHTVDFYQAQESYMSCGKVCPQLILLPRSYSQMKQEYFTVLYIQLLGKLDALSHTINNSASFCRPNYTFKKLPKILFVFFKSLSANTNRRCPLTYCVRIQKVFLSLPPQAFLSLTLLLLLTGAPTPNQNENVCV